MRAEDRNLADERIALTRVRRQLLDVKVKRDRGELVPAKDAVAVQRATAEAVKAQLRAVPRRAVQAGLPQEHEALVLRLIEAALREVGAARTAADLERLAEGEE